MQQWAWRFWILIAAQAGAGAVSLGALIAHGAGFLGAHLNEPAVRASLDNAVLYQFLHALALLAVGLWLRSLHIRSALGRAAWLCLNLSALLFTLGIVLFCGLIYMRHLVQQPIAPQLIPVGGSSFIGGWLLLTVAVLLEPTTDQRET